MIGKIKYIGNSFGVEQLTNNKIYDVVGIELPFVRIIDDSGEDYLYSIYKPSCLDDPNLNGKWVITEDKQKILKRYINIE